MRKPPTNPQAHAIRVEVKDPTYMQIDGEPWRMPVRICVPLHIVLRVIENVKCVVCFFPIRHVNLR